MSIVENNSQFFSVKFFNIFFKCSWVIVKVFCGGKLHGVNEYAATTISAT